MSVAIGSASENIYKVRQIFIANGYDRHTFRHNMGLIVLASPVPESIATPVKLYTEPFDISIDASVVGYGLTMVHSRVYPSSAQAVSMAIQSNKECSYFADFDNATQVCAYGGRGKDVCGGDEGAPLLVTSDSGEVAVLGIASYTTGPAGVKGLECGNGDRLVFFEMGGSWAKWIAAVSAIPYDNITDTNVSLGSIHRSKESSNSGSSTITQSVSKSITAFSANVGAIEGPSVELGDSPPSSAADTSLASTPSMGTALALLAFTLFAVSF
ncbi:Serine protease 55 [Coemansia sp. RSA 1933]|nr:Serine protease 55 [Coemansia sp. RSA 1933]